jgi:hypothetical protein
MLHRDCGGDARRRWKSKGGHQQRSRDEIVVQNWAQQAASSKDGNC